LTQKELKTALKDNDFRKFIKRIELDEKPMPGYEQEKSKKRPFHTII